MKKFYNESCICDEDFICEDCDDCSNLESGDDEYEEVLRFERAWEEDEEDDERWNEEYDE